MSDYFIPLKPGNTYHIFCRANASDKLFPLEENYSFFLKKVKLHISVVADTFAYNLLPNHFHFLIRIKSYSELESIFLQLKKKEMSLENISPFIMERFSNLLNSYTKSYNKRFDRRGNLFLPLRRVKIKNDSDFASEIFTYIKIRFIISMSKQLKHGSGRLINLF